MQVSYMNALHRPCVCMVVCVYTSAFRVFSCPDEVTRFAGLVCIRHSVAACVLNQQRAAESPRWSGTNVLRTHSSVTSHPLVRLRLTVTDNVFVM